MENNQQLELERIIRDCLKDDYSKFCEIPSIKEMFSKIISAILSAGYVKLEDVESEENEIRQAIASAYCTNKNSYKILDLDLIESIVNAIMQAKGIMKVKGE